LLNAILKAMDWRKEYPQEISIGFSLIYALIVVIYVVAVSFLFKRNKRKYSLGAVALMTGGFAFVFYALFITIFSYSRNIWPMLLLMGSITFSIGFLFPLLFKLFNKRHLISNNFY